MKIKTGSQPWGSALLATLLTVFIVAMALASFLTMVSVQHQSTLRSQSWNSAVPAMEAGVEEALTQIYHHGTTNFSTSDGWRLNAADGFYHNIGRLKVGDSKEVYSYDVGIKPPTVPGPDQPVIECLGYAPAPLNLATSYRSPYGMILGGLVPTYSPDIPTTKRKVQVIAKRQTPVSYAMLAKGQINMNGNNIATDSFDSADPAHSNNGRYDPSRDKDKGDVATNSGLVNSFSAGNADIKGHVSTGPNGSVAIGSNGSVGDAFWVSSGESGIEPGWSSNDANVDIPDAKLDFSPVAKPSGGQYPALTGPVYDYILYANHDYILSSFHGNILVLGPGTARVYVDSSFYLSGTDQVTINPEAGLQVYVAAASATIGGNGIVNHTGDAMAFQYYGLNSNTSLNFIGNASFTGVIYAPYADFKLNGGGNNGYDFVGASVTRSVTMNGHFHFHYDENLARRFPIAQYVVFSWNEISPN